MNKILVFLIVLALFSTFAHAISAPDAVNFVTRENHFLHEGEEFDQPELETMYNDDAYFVVPVLSGNTEVTFFAVKTSAKELEASRVKNRELFETTYILREFIRLQQRISDTPNFNWIITSKYSGIFSGLGGFLNDEIIELSLIDGELNDSAVSDRISDMTNLLVQLSITSESISGKIDDAQQLYASFTEIKPDTSDSGKLKQKCLDVFSLIFDLDADAREYGSEFEKLKQGISASDSDLSTKTHLINLAKPPAELDKIGEYWGFAKDLEDEINAIYSRAQLKIDSFLEEFDSRLERNDAYVLLYENNESLRQRTNDDFTALSAAKDYILNKDRRLLWKNQLKVRGIERNWGKAIEYFDKRDYSRSMEYANDAIEDAVDVYKDGFVDDSKPLISMENILPIVMLLIAALVIIYMWNNRGKIMQIVKPKEVDEEVNISAFDE